MVALLSPTHFDEPTTADQLAAGEATVLRRRHLAIVDPAPAEDRETAMVLPLRRAAADPEAPRLEILALAAFFGLAVIAGLTFSLLQSAPPAETWAEVQSAAVGAGAVPAAGESTLIVAPGDTLWDLAGDLAPGADRRQIVALLERRNGGSALQAGQVLIVPAGLKPAQSGDLAAP